MKKSKYSESQIIAILKEQDAGRKVGDICREHGISQPTFYQWKSRYGGLDVNQLKRLKELEAEVCQYKKIVAEQTLAITVLKDVIEKKL
jgi:putative transposase